MVNQKKVKPGVIFSTHEFAITKGISLSAASHQLKTAKKRGDIIRLTRGIWANQDHPYFNPLACVPWLLGKEQGYVSFLTALHRWGALSQIPPVIQVATTGHSRKLETPIGKFEFFQLKPQMMLQGIEWTHTQIPYRIATLEKALLDTLYVSNRKGRRFASLPELHLEFNSRKILHLLKNQKVPAPVVKAIKKKLQLPEQ